MFFSEETSVCYIDYVLYYITLSKTTNNDIDIAMHTVKIDMCTYFSDIYQIIFSPMFFFIHSFHETKYLHFFSFSYPLLLPFILCDLFNSFGFFISLSKTCTICCFFFSCETIFSFVYLFSSFFLCCLHSEEKDKTVKYVIWMWI